MLIVYQKTVHFLYFICMHAKMKTDMKPETVYNRCTDIYGGHHEVRMV